MKNKKEMKKETIKHLRGRIGDIVYDDKIKDEEFIAEVLDEIAYVLSENPIEIKDN